MKRALSAATCAAVVFVAAPAQADHPQLLKAQSRIAFTSKQMGVPVTGHFRSFEASVVFEPKRPEAAKITLSIDLASASLGSADAESELARPDWFHIKAFPQATFQSAAVSTAGAAGQFNVSGMLSIKSARRDLVVPVKLTQAAGLTTAVGAFSIKRLDYGIGDGAWKDTSLVADGVEVSFRLVLSGVGPL